MKRSDELKKLSWEHHDALKFGRHIRKGLERGTDPELVGRYARYVTERFLEPHFRLEEEALVKRLDDEQKAEPVVQQVLDEHRQFGRMKEKLAQGGEARHQLLLAFVAMLRAHVNLEEKHFFPFVEQALDADALEQARQEIDRGHVPGELGWSPKFWE